MFQTIPNSGIMLNDRLDELRGRAILANREHPIPPEIVEYIRALESAHLSRVYETRRRWAEEIGWDESVPEAPPE